jgi:CubicO group peptidase (beta-lactamase class C family)
MKVLKILVILIPLLNGCSINHTKPAINSLTQNGMVTGEQLGLIFESSKIFPDNTQISIAFITDNDVKFYGIKRQGDSLVYINNRNAVFEIGSITKVFTATLLANYIVGGTVALDDAINNKLPFKLNNDIKVTFKGLANHTSGLPRLPSGMMFAAITNPDNPYKNYNEDKLKKYLSKKLNPSNKPGENYEYSNLGAGLLGYTLSKLEGKSYQALLSEKIFSKYEMNNSSTDRTELKNKLVDGLNSRGNRTSNWDLASLEGAGAILSTVEDLSKFASAQFDESNKELALTREGTFAIHKNMDIGLGWHIIKSKPNNVWYWHNGGTGGYASSMAIDTAKKTGIVILSNVSAFNKKRGGIDQLCFELIKTLNKK